MRRLQNNLLRGTGDIAQCLWEYRRDPLPLQALHVVEHFLETPGMTESDGVTLLHHVIEEHLIERDSLREVHQRILDNIQSLLPSVRGKGMRRMLYELKASHPHSVSRTVQLLNKKYGASGVHSRVLHDVVHSDGRLARWRSLGVLRDVLAFVPLQCRVVQF